MHAFSFTHKGHRFTVSPAGEALTVSAHGATHTADAIQMLLLGEAFDAELFDQCPAIWAEAIEECLLDEGLIVVDEWNGGYTTPDHIAEMESEAQWTRDHEAGLRSTYYTRANLL